MKKGKWVFLCALAAVPVLIGCWIRFSGGTPSEEAATTADTEPTAQTSAAPSGEAAEAEANTGSETGWLTRSYPERNVEINAACPAQTEATALPLLTARLSYDYYEQMAQDLLLARYPQSEAVEEAAYDDTGWQLLSEDGTKLLASIHMFDLGLAVFNDSAQDITLHADCDTSGDKQAFYNPLDSTHSLLEEDGTLSAADAVAIAIRTVQPYTDFDLSAYNVSLETNTDGEAAYRIYLQLSYAGTPVALYSQVHGTQVDTEVRNNGVLGYLQGVFCFADIREGENCSVMSMEDAVTAFTDQAGTLFDSAAKTLTVYHMQREYTAQVSDEEEFTFRPVWTFYYYLTADTEAGEAQFHNVAKLYADTGEICTDDGSYLDTLRGEDGE